MKKPLLREAQLKPCHVGLQDGFVVTKPTLIVLYEERRHKTLKKHKHEVNTIITTP